MQLTPTRRWSPRHLFECLTDLAGDPLVLGEQPRARILAVEKLKRRSVAVRNLAFKNIFLSRTRVMPSSSAKSSIDLNI